MNLREKEEQRKIARSNIEKLFNTSIYSIIDKAFEIEGEYVDEYLISTHYALREMVKKVTGTGRGIEGFSELWYFLYIKKFLEKFLTVQFKIIKTADKTVHYHFETNYNEIKLILSSDLSTTKNFKLRIHSRSTTRPDIFIGIEKNSEIIPIAIFEIKLHQKTAQDIEGVLNKFKDMMDTLTNSNIELPFFIFLYLQHSQYEFGKIKQDKFNTQLSRFKNLSDKTMLVINRIIRWDKIYDNQIEGSIYEIMNKIISFIKESYS